MTLPLGFHGLQSCQLAFGRSVEARLQRSPLLVTINDWERVVEGAAKLNLTVHGTLNQTVFPWELAFDYNGVVCP